MLFAMCEIIITPYYRMTAAHHILTVNFIFWSFIPSHGNRAPNKYKLFYLVMIFNTGTAWLFKTTCIIFGSQAIEIPIHHRKMRSLFQLIFVHILLISGIYCQFNVTSTNPTTNGKWIVLTILQQSENLKISESAKNSNSFDPQHHVTGSLSLA